ncbi:hypothetical protein TOPH_04534 [Tolypocladium ophioglossoides CBS 100239]|uniref:Uncharacterized protein n=1 Tax=Tolypocladium ophioglossoides (strain CBS 100239) TaxID=1163406 RepID=A0A0L0N9J5_TOLOC|nr:hypothetical protein TOPH_04534 [Tolypocladium ophioglossoides CBS 100239]
MSDKCWSLPITHRHLDLALQPSLAPFCGSNRLYLPSKPCRGGPRVLRRLRTERLHSPEDRTAGNNASPVAAGRVATSSSVRRRETGPHKDGETRTITQLKQCCPVQLAKTVAASWTSGLSSIILS